MRLRDALIEAKLLPPPVSTNGHLHAERVDQSTTEFAKDEPVPHAPGRIALRNTVAARRLRIGRVARILARPRHWYDIAPLDQERYLKLAETAVDAVAEAERDERYEHTMESRGRPIPAADAFRLAIQVDPSTRAVS